MLTLWIKSNMKQTPVELSDYVIRSFTEMNGLIGEETADCLFPDHIIHKAFFSELSGIHKRHSEMFILVLFEFSVS